MTNPLQAIDDAIKSLNELTIDLRDKIQSPYLSRKEYESEMRDMVVVSDGRRALTNLKAAIAAVKGEA